MTGPVESETRLLERIEQLEAERDELKRINEFDIHAALAEANENGRIAAAERDEARAENEKLRKALEQIERIDRIGIGAGKLARQALADQEAN